MNRSFVRPNLPDLQPGQLLIACLRQSAKVDDVSQAWICVVVAGDLFQHAANFISERDASDVLWAELVP